MIPEVDRNRTGVIYYGTNMFMKDVFGRLEKTNYFHTSIFFWLKYCARLREFGDVRPIVMSNGVLSEVNSAQMFFWSMVFSCAL